MYRGDPVARAIKERSTPIIGSYEFSLHAIPTAVAAAVVLVAGAFTVARERNSRSVWPFMAVAVPMFLWMLGSSMMYLSATEQTGDFWSRFGTVGIVFIPTVAALFCVNLADTLARHRRTIFAMGVLSALFATTIWVSPEHIRGVHRHWWGYYPVYGWVGRAFMLFTTATMAGCLAMLWRELKRARAGSTVHKRTRLLLVGVATATLAGVDFLATQGINVYPIAFLPTMAFFAIVVHVTRRFHLFDITPALAGQKIVETMSDALFIVDDDRVIRLVNESAVQMFGGSGQSLVGRPFLAGMNLLETRAVFDTIMGGQRVRNQEMAFRVGDGDERTLSVSGSALRTRDGDVIAAVFVMCDVTDRRRAQDRIRFLAYNDAQTGLPNRLQFDRVVRTMLEKAAEKQRPVTLLYLDIDRFKRVNDTLGHDAGDQLLIAVADRLRACVTTSNPLSLDRSRALNGFVARLGGDEFAIALSGIDQIMQVRRVARFILDEFARPFIVDDTDLFVSASIGIAQFPRDGTDTQQLLKAADTAMYNAKETGRSNYKFYREDMEQAVVTEIDLEADLRRALDDNQFEVHYQPQIDFRTGAIIGCEALLRWNHPERGFVSPARFVPVAEESGLICAIGQWVLMTACQQNRAWHDMGFDELKVAVNLSERQFVQNTLVLIASQALAKSGLPPSALELELTEGTIMRNVRDTQFTLNELKAMGIHISVDDFGTGYSSLSYLKKFPIDIIKIDRSFVDDIENATDDAAITAAIIAMARALNLDVIAEGVETDGQARVLLAKGCHLMQGYHFSRPLPADAFTEFLKETMPRSEDAQSLAAQSA